MHDALGSAGRAGRQHDCDRIDRSSIVQMQSRCVGGRSLFEEVRQAHDIQLRRVGGDAMRRVLEFLVIHDVISVEPCYRLGETLWRFQKVQIGRYGRQAARLQTTSPYGRRSAGT